MEKKKSLFHEECTFFLVFYNTKCFLSLQKKIEPFQTVLFTLPQIQKKELKKIYLNSLFQKPLAFIGFFLWKLLACTLIKVKDMSYTSAVLLVPRTVHIIYSKCSISIQGMNYWITRSVQTTFLGCCWNTWLSHHLVLTNTEGSLNL